MDSHFAELREKELVWLPEHGMGYYPVKGEEIYDEKYFQNYQKLAETSMGREITEMRASLIRSFVLDKDRGAQKTIIDIGIGSGMFVQRMNSYQTCYGFDINPVAVEWLKKYQLLLDPTKSIFEIATFWDSLEHIHNPDTILKNVMEWVFVSLPIFEDCNHVLRSKHFKKEEHCWYWTKDGFINWMDKKGFAVMRVDDFETRLGRDGILTFAFRRVR